MTILMFLLLGLLCLFPLTLVFCNFLENPRFATLRATLVNPKYRWLSIVVLFSPALAVYFWPATPFADPTLQSIVVMAKWGSVLGFFVTSSLAAVWLVMPSDPKYPVRRGVAIGVTLLCASYRLR